MLPIVAHSWPLIRWLNLTAVRFVGVISYSFYLCHDPIIEIFKYWFGGANLFSMSCAAVSSFLFAYIMHYLVEKKCSGLRRSIQSKVFKG